MVFFVNDGGDAPVLEWLRTECTRAERREIGADLRVVQDGWPAGLPVCRPLGVGLYEVRSHLGQRASRLLFCLFEGRIVVLHGFFKKTQRTPKAALDIARKRMAELKKG